ncbi:HNH endonuclease [Halorubrum sp. CSM-61]|uniref:HNH endonuclease n=1 Tax=Halorubrum sp. CSM-61 TaxID=2485838 RepID=UPI000F4B3E6A|nr:HNH endonuclease signature motif containing protein [Halorubrum sp. CSM-61]
MDQIRAEVKDASALLKKFGADPRFDLPDSYGERNSYGGNGDYPPDWDQRRRAVWWLQDDLCGRCGRDTGNGGHVHHVNWLADGGTNRLENLVGLCVDCHALMHPTNQDLNGDWKAAPKFPREGSHDEVAVIRREDFDSNRGAETAVGRDFEKLEAETSTHKTTYTSKSPVLYDIPPHISRRFPESGGSRAVLSELNSLLLMRGRVPENETHNTRTVQIEATQSGLLGWLSPFEPRVDVTVSAAEDTGRSFDSVRERRALDGGHDTEIAFSENVTEATVAVTGGDGELVSRRVAFDDESPTQSVSVSVSPPSLSASTVGGYARSFGEKSLLLPLLYGLLALIFIPAAGVVLLFSVIGMLAGGIGLVGWTLIALFFGGSWVTVGQMALATVLSLVAGSVAVMILEFFGIDLGE